MKVKTLKRSAVGSVARECLNDVHPAARNLNPVYHPMQRAREYTRAVTAAKMERMFAKPLIAGNLGLHDKTTGHSDAVTCLSVSRKALLPTVSGAADGVVKLWDLASRSSVATIAAHTRTVTGVVFDAVSGQTFYSCSDDGYIHQWSLSSSFHPNSEKATTDDSDHDGDGKHGVNNKKKNTTNSNPKARSYMKATAGNPNGLFLPTSAATTTTTTPVAEESSHGPLQSWRTNGSFKSIDHSWISDTFATASDEAVQLWSPGSTSPLQTHKDLWNGGADTVTTVRFNPSEPYLLAHCSADRGIGLHDTRTGTALKKTILHMRSNDLQWNPMEPMVFAVANEDCNAYTFDMRYLARPNKIFRGHVGAVMSVSWNPTGREFVTGSYDKTLRIYNSHAGSGVARDVYHTKRMQRVFAVSYTLDGKFILSGSDDTNVRLWKAVANEQLGRQLTVKEESALHYRKALLQRYQHLPGVKKIVKSRKIPRPIQRQAAQVRIQKEAADRKQANRVKHNNPSVSKEAKPGQKIYKFVSETDKVVVKEME